jgi:NitT/TauT family transport system substrate-binding protein
MKRSSIFLIAILFCAIQANVAAAADKFTLQLKWVAQAQFAGYFVAKAKGFYDEQGLDVTIKPGGPDVSPEQSIAGGGADAIVDWLPSALAAREKGLALVNVAQIFNHAGNNITCLRASGVASPADFKGKRIGIIFGGNEFPFLAWTSKLALKTTGASPDITVIKQGFNVDPILNKQADCISTQIYNEYYQILDAGVPADKLVTFFFEDYGVATLEDGLYTTSDKLGDPAFVNKLARFVAASIKGWRYATEHVDEAAQIVVDSDPSGVAKLNVQSRQLKEIAKLIGDPPNGVGWLDPAAFDRTVDVLLAGTVDPVITRKPQNAWTHDVFDKAKAVAK